MISKKKFGTTVTAFGVAAGMLLGSAAPACRGDSENGAGNAERSGGCTGHAK